MAKSSFSNERGFSLIETMFATGLLATAVVALAQMFVISVKNNQNARTGGYAVTLTSGNTGAATVPGTVTISAGATSATFVVTSKPVNGRGMVGTGMVGGRLAHSVCLPGDNW